MGALLRRSGNAVYNVCKSIGWKPDMLIQCGVGGYHQEVDVIREAWPKTVFIGFDPIMVKDYPGQFHQVAIGSEEIQDAPFYVKRRHQDGSSMFPMPEEQIRRRDKVQVRTLDTLFPDKLPGNVLLWLDCENSELNALHGGIKFIECVDMVNVELTARTSGAAWVPPQVIYRWLRDRGFYMLWVHTMRIPDGQYDAIFVRQNIFKPECCCIPSEIERFFNATP